MKKTGILLLAVLYVAVSSGIIVNLHYCMNRFASADFGFTGLQKECGKCGMGKDQSHGCCHDEVKLVKLQEDQNKSAQVAFDFTSLQQPGVIPSLFLTASFYNDDEISHDPEHSPPLISRQGVYLQHCVFRI